MYLATMRVFTAGNPPFKGQSKENKIPEAWQRCRSPFFMQQFKQIIGKLADKNKTNFD